MRLAPARPASGRSTPVPFPCDHGRGAVASRLLGQTLTDPKPTAPRLDECERAQRRRPPQTMGALIDGFEITTGIGQLPLITGRDTLHQAGRGRDIEVAPRQTEQVRKVDVV